MCEVFMRQATQSCGADGQVFLIYSVSGYCDLWYCLVGIWEALWCYIPVILAVGSHRQWTMQFRLAWAI